MSRTHNEHRSLVFPNDSTNRKSHIISKNYGKTCRKMKPMVGDDRYKYNKWIYNDSISVPYSIKTKAMKLELKNANRSIKKSDRQKSKKDINNRLIED